MSTLSVYLIVGVLAVVGVVVAVVATMVDNSVSKNDK